MVTGLGFFDAKGVCQVGDVPVRGISGPINRMTAYATTTLAAALTALTNFDITIRNAAWHVVRAGRRVQLRNG
jgi:hypothetical protein